jgi:hypothetical protein
MIEQNNRINEYNILILGFVFAEKHKASKLTDSMERVWICLWYLRFTTVSDYLPLVSSNIPLFIYFSEQL